MTEQAINIADRLYECRRSMRAILGERYGEVIGGYAKTICHVAEERRIGTLQAATAMAKEMQALYADPIITLSLMAAAVDLSENHKAT